MKIWCYLGIQRLGDELPLPARDFVPVPGKTCQTWARERRRMVRTPRRAPPQPRGHAAFLQGKIPGATSPKGPLVQARAVFGGVAPAPPVFRSSWAGRPGGFRNSLLSKALARPQVFRGGGKQASRVHGECFAGAFSPKQRTTVPRSARPQPLSGEEGHRDGAAGLRYADVHSRPGQGSSRRSSTQCSSAGAIPTIAA